MLILNCLKTHIRNFPGYTTVILFAMDIKWAMAEGLKKHLRKLVFGLHATVSFDKLWVVLLVNAKMCQPI